MYQVPLKPTKLLQKPPGNEMNQDMINMIRSGKVIILTTGLNLGKD